MSEAKKPRQLPPSIVERANILAAIKAADPKRPDVMLAADISREMGRAVSATMVKSYRLQLGLKSVRMPTREEMAAELAALQRRVSELQQPSLDLQVPPSVEARVVGPDDQGSELAKQLQTA